MDVYVLRLKMGKKKKDYNFENISDAAIFESTFFSKEESSKISREVLYRNVEESKKLLKELSHNPIKYAEKEFLSWFYPEKIPSQKKKSGAN